MVDKMAKTNATRIATENKNRVKVEAFMIEIKKIIENKIIDKTFSKNNPFLVDKKRISGLPETLEYFGDKEDEKNWIFYGPPGTGKTFALNKIATNICINNTNKSEELIGKLYEKLHKKYKSSCQKTFYQILNRYIGNLFEEYKLKIYLKCDTGVEYGYHKYVCGTGNYSTNAYRIFRKNNPFEFVKESEDDNCLNIVPKLSKDNDINGLLKTIDDEDIKKLVIQIVKLNLQEQKHLSVLDVTKIVFHPSYTYEDFVGGIKPDLEKKNLTDQKSSADGSATQEGLTKPNSQTSLIYKYTPGVMLDLISKAWKNKTVRHYLIIDEFNRGNIAAIFGEFLYLIENDKRSSEKDSGDKYIFLPGGVYPWDDGNRKDVPPFSEKCKIRMPRNIFIVGALNTADRSIATMDFAMRRRFNFIKFKPDEELIKDFKWRANDVTDNVRRLFVSLNKSITYKLGADHEIGHSYFMLDNNVKKNTEAFLKDLFERKIVPLLEAYCDHDEQTVKKILANSILLFLFFKENKDTTGSNNPRILEKLINLKFMSHTQIKTSISTYIIDNEIEGLTETDLKDLKGQSSKNIATKSLKELTDILVSLVGSLSKKP